MTTKNNNNNNKPSFVTTVMQGTYNHGPETDHVSFQGTECCSYSEITIYGTHNVISHAECFLILH